MKKTTFLLVSIVLILGCGVKTINNKEVEYLIKNPISSDGIYEQDKPSIEFANIRDLNIKVKVNSTPSISTSEFARITLANEQNYLPERIALNVYFTRKGKNNFKKLTKKNIRKRLIYVINEKVVNSIMILSSIEEGSTQFLLPKKHLNTLFVKNTAH